MSDIDQRLYRIVSPFIGVPYKYGGSNPMTGFDCSGFVIEVFKMLGVVGHRFDATSEDLRKKFSEIEAPKAGALVFYGPPHRATHVALCLSASLMIEAAGGDSTTTTPSEAHKRDACVRIRPINYRTDLLGYAMPYYPFNFLD